MATLSQYGPILATILAAALAAWAVIRKTTLERETAVMMQQPNAESALRSDLLKFSEQLGMRLDHVQEQCDQWRDKVRQAEEQIDELNREIAGLRIMVETLTIEKERLEAEVGRLAREVSNLQALVLQLRARETALQAVVNGVAH